MAHWRHARDYTGGKRLPVDSTRSAAVMPRARTRVCQRGHLPKPPARAPSVPVCAKNMPPNQADVAVRWHRRLPGNIGAAARTELFDYGAAAAWKVSLERPLLGACLLSATSPRRVNLCTSRIFDRSTGMRQRMDASDVLCICWGCWFPRDTTWKWMWARQAARPRQRCVDEYEWLIFVA